MTAFEFHRALDVADAARALGEDGAKAIAGGTALMLGADRGEARPRLVVGVGHLAELQALDAGDGGVRLGAALRLARLECAALPAWAMALVDAAGSIASPALRAQGTVGGDLAHGAHTADLVPAALALDARLELAAGALPASAIRMCLHDALPRGSLLVALVAAAPERRAASGYAKFGLGRGMEYPLASVAVALEAEDGVVAEARVAVGAAARAPVRLEEVEEAWRGVPLDVDAAPLAARALGAAGVPWIGDHAASARYRRHLAAVLAGRAFARARDRLEEGT